MEFVGGNAWSRASLLYSISILLMSHFGKLSMASSEHSFVAAIDFGTTYSGYSFSSSTQFEGSTLEVTGNWTGEYPIYWKTSSCILFTPDGYFHSFGSEARDKYSDLALDGKQDQWRYFQRFKMKLYENMSLKRSFALEDDQGNEMQAMEVFTAAIKHLKDHMIESYKQHLTGVKMTDILFVLTVPAIWSDASKQFMREAAELAGIEKGNLLLALEPEAASLYCKYTTCEQTEDIFTLGSKYVVLDAGGGIIDTTIHEVQRDGSLKEIHKASGGDWGGTKVDHAFETLLSKIIGNSAFELFRTNHKADTITLFREFEAKKRDITPNASPNEEIAITIPSSMEDACDNINGVGISTLVKSNETFTGKVFVAGDKLRLSSDTAKGLFKDPATHIVNHLKELLSEPSATGVNSILMVGGFSESPVLQDEIRRNFSNIRLIVARDAAQAVLKGAILYGYKPKTFKTRVSKRTFGVTTSMDFNSEMHNISKQFVSSDGTLKCKDIFHIYVRMGDSLDIGQPQVVEWYSRQKPEQTSIIFQVYVSAEEDPMYVTDPGCTRIGQLNIDISDINQSLEEPVKVCITFSNTEVEVQAYTKTTNKKVSAAFDFL